jgi:hypothetical protein
LFQKASSVINAFSSPKRFCSVATSKKPPQMREFLGSGRQLGGNHFEHGASIGEPEAGIQKRLADQWRGFGRVPAFGAARGFYF